jgi:hypothetical protein
VLLSLFFWRNGSSPVAVIASTVLREDERGRAARVLA